MSKRTYLTAIAAAAGFLLASGTAMAHDSYHVHGKGWGDNKGTAMVQARDKAWWRADAHMEYGWKWCGKVKVSCSKAGAGWECKADADACGHRRHH